MAAPRPACGAAQRLVATALAAGLVQSRLGVASDVPLACPVPAPEEGGFATTAAWDAIYNAQPHTAIAPLPAKRSVPVGIPGICGSKSFNFQSTNWNFIDLIGTEWVTRPKTQEKIELLVGADTSSPTMIGIGIVSYPKPEVRFHFRGTAKHAVLAVPLVHKKSETMGSIEGSGLLKWMCQVGKERCDAAKVEQSTAYAFNPDPLTSAGKQGYRRVVGPGRCEGVPKTLNGTSLQDQDACASACVGDDACTSYAWSKRIKSCLLYTSADPTVAPLPNVEASWEVALFYSYTCTRVYRDNAPALPAAPATAAVEEVDLDLKRLFDKTAVPDDKLSASKVNVRPHNEGCFTPFDWYTLSHSILVPLEDWPLFTGVTKVDTSQYLFSSPTDQEVNTAVQGNVAPRGEVTVERVCVRTCDGGFVGKCEDPKNSYEQDEYYKAYLKAMDTEEQELYGIKGKLATFMGDDKVEILLEPCFLMWFGILLLLIFLIAFLLACCFACWYCRPKPRKFKEVTLRYEDAQGSEFRSQGPDGRPVLEYHGATVVRESASQEAGASWMESLLGSHK